jgi:hypothetical protein
VKNDIIINMKFGKVKFLSRYLSISLIGLLVLIISWSILPHGANAASPDDTLVNVVPQNPAPNQNTSITLSSFVNNLDSVLITWSVNGKNVSSGIGKKTFLVNAPALGGETDVVATIAFPDGIVEKKIVIKPSVMVLLWQADDSYVPPFYKGKAMPSPSSEVKVVAMPEIKNSSGIVNPKNMLYAWKLDFTNNQDGSGFGKNSFIYTNDYLDNSNNVEVTASTMDQSQSSDASIDIGTTQPKILFYKNDPGLGTIWQQALSDGHKVQGTEIMLAAPYFISPKDIRIPSLTWTWSINDNFVNILGPEKNLLPIAAQPGVSGTSKIDLSINNSFKLFESVSKEINVNF